MHKITTSKRDFFINVIVFVCASLALLVSFYFSHPDNVRASGGNLSWQAIASSSDGTKLVAVTWCGNIFTSGDSGVTWTAQTSPGYQCWVATASNASGSKLYAVSQNYLYSSSDSGITWTQRIAPGAGNWHGVASNAAGDKVVAASSSGDIWTSSDSGATWTNRTLSLGHKNWYSVASNDLGDKLVAVDEAVGYIYTSTDYGVTWTTNGNSSGQGYWFSVASDSTGQNLVAADENNGYLYTSTDYGVTWTTNGNSSGQRVWYSVASDASGTKLVAGAWSNHYVYVSTDGGVTWTTNDNSSGTGYWGAVASDSTGGHLFAANNNGEILASTDSGVTWNTNSGGATGYVHVTVVDQDNNPVTGAHIQVECSGGSWIDFGTTDSNGVVNDIPGVGAGCSDNIGIIFSYSKSGYLESQTYFSNSEYYYTNDNINSIVNLPLIEAGHTNSYLAEYWNVPIGAQSRPRFPIGAPDFSATAQTIDSNWLNGSPNSAINVDGFLARYSKTTHFDEGDYQFTIDSDDGNKIYIDGVLVNDDWNDRGSGSPDVQTQTIAAGDHTITVEYYENSGGAALSFSYVPVNVTTTSVAVYESADTAVTPDTPGDASTLDNTIARDGAFLTTSISTDDSGYDSQVFKFTPDFTGIDLPKFSTDWFGHGAVPSDKNVSLSIWNFLTSTWDQIISSHCATDCAITGDKTGSDYKDESSNVWVWAKADNSYGPPTISNETDNGGLLPIEWDTSVAATTQIAYDTVSHTDWSDYANHLTDSTLVTRHTMSPSLSSNTGQTWSGIATSADGSKAASITNCGYIWTTSDYGNTWVQSSAPSSCWYAIAMSADGSVIAAGVNGGYIYISTDGGVNWSTNGDVSGATYWQSITMSSDGTHIAAVDRNNGFIYTSTDTGVTWTTNGDSSGRAYWYSIASDSTGDKLAAVDVNDGYAYTSIDGGVTWTTNSNSSGHRSWRSIASSSDGTKLAAVDYGGLLYLSNDSGATWNPSVGAGSNNWFTVSMSSDGSKIMAAPNCGNVFTSTDGGATWTNHTILSYCWTSSATSSDGQYMYLNKYGGSIYVSADSGASWINKTGQPWYYRIRSTNATGSVVTSGEYSLNFDGASSCPFIFTWDGTKYNFIIDASSSGTMGQGLDIDQWKATPFFKTPAYPNPESFAKVPNGKLVPITDQSGSYYSIRTTFELNEVNYYDQAALEVIDHSQNVDVYPDHRNNKQIHTISKSATSPIWVKDARGNDVTSLIALNDNVYWHSLKLDDPSYLTMKLTNSSTTPANIKLVIKKAKEGLFQGNKQSDVFQYKNSSGVFVNVPTSMDPYTGNRTGISTKNRILTNNYGTDTKVVDLSGLTIKDNEIRFVVTNRQLQTDIDWIAVDTSPDEAVTVTKLSPYYADLHSRGVSVKVPTNPNDPNMPQLLEPDYSRLAKTVGKGNPLSGNATKYGDIKDLLSSVDDKYAVLVQGDEISLKYTVPSQQNGTERDFIYDTWDYHKSAHNALGDTIGPLPFNAMSNYPYHENLEHFPTDADHVAYQNTYNTRVINWGTAQDPQIHHSLNTDVISLTISEATDVTPPSTPTASPSADTYTATQSVTLSSTGSDSIRYSTTGIPVDCSSGTLYSGAISVAVTETIYARACKSSNSTSSTANFPFVISAPHYGSVLIIPQPAQGSTSTVSTTSTQAISNTAAPITNVGLPPGFQFKKDLKPLTNKSDIKNLQIFLNNNGFSVSEKGVGSKGKESNYFGLKTKQQLIKFQEAYAKDILYPQGLKKGTGILGPYTRKIINSWLANATQ